MKKATIGILQADGSYYAIMEEAGAGQKNLILTPAGEGQKAAKIDIYRCEDDSGVGATRIGTLALENSLNQDNKDIHLHLGLDPDGHLAVGASWSSDDEEEQSIQVDLNDYRFDVPHEDTRKDSDILEDPQLDEIELDDVGNLANSEENKPSAEDALFDELAGNMDLPEDFSLDEPEEKKRSDQDILDDENLTSFELDDLDSAEKEDLPDSKTQPETDEPNFDFEAELESDNEPLSLPDLDIESDESEEKEDPESFSDPLAELESGFGTDLEENSVSEAEENKVSLEGLDLPDDLPNLSLDDDPYKVPDDIFDENTGAGDLPDLSMDDVPDKGSHDDLTDFSLDDHDSEGLSSLPKLGSEDPMDLSWDSDLDSGADKNSGDNESSLPPFEVSDDLSFLDSQLDSGAASSEPATSKPEKQKKVKEKQSRVQKTAPSHDDIGIRDKTALVISLLTLGLLILTLLGLLFLSILKPAKPAALTPEVYKTTSNSILIASSSSTQDFSAIGLEIPDELKKISLRTNLLNGERDSDISRQWGSLVAVRKDNSLSW